ncbi:MAG: 2-dehydropantoate 2-reductase [Alphaproteobacteria bacterium]|nr:2-dehydropantoate 2-reductase [Alphaproteobacteria bacterium]
MRIAIMGSGGIGGFLGAKLATAGHEVIFIARGRHLQAIKSNGLKLLSTEGDIDIHPATAYSNSRDAGSVDLILFCVKLYDTAAAARACLAMMADDTFILTLQNGVESVDMISAIVGAGKTIGGSIYVSANIDRPGVIRHSGGTNSIHFAETSNLPGRRTEILETIFNDAGLVGQCADNLQRMLWTKFVLLCANASLGSLTDSGAVALCSDPDGRALLTGAMQEVCAVARAMGIILPENTVAELLAVIMNAAPRQDLIASQCLDLRSGNRLELEWIQGTLHRLGRKYHVPTPINSTAYVALKRFAAGTLS